MMTKKSLYNLLPRNTRLLLGLLVAAIFSASGVTSVSAQTTWPECGDVATGEACPESAPSYNENDGNVCTLPTCQITLVDIGCSGACALLGCGIFPGCDPEYIGVGYCKDGTWSEHELQCPSDGNSCTTESCMASAGCVSTARPYGSFCVDDLFCNGDDFCISGQCIGHQNPPCPGADGDSNCNESCDEAADNCNAFDGIAASCDDGQYCNGTDRCQPQISGGGSCTYHTGDPCTGPDGDSDCSESCNESSNSCSANDPDGSACTDGAFCNGADTCSGGACSVHAGDPCTGPDGDSDCTESCDESSNSCTANDPNGSTCPDNGAFCDGDESCQGGICEGDGDPCDGGPLCNDECNEGADNCYNLVGSQCGNDGNECTTDQCDGAGTCENLAVADDQPCTDNGLFCDGSESCQSGNCTSSGDPCDGPDADSDCSETCDEAADNCGANDPNGSACPDNGVFCDGTESCQSGSCVGAGDPCAGGAECNGCNEGDESCLTPAEDPCTDDGDECTNDWCDGEGNCVHPGLPGADVDNDGDLDNDDDGICDLLDNCYLDCNPDQADDDGDCEATGANPNACGDVCDVCPNFNEAAQDPDDAETCATANYNIRNQDCCWPNDSTAATTDPLCGGPADDLILSVGGTDGPGDAPGGASIKIPANCQDGETFSVTGESRSVDEGYWADTANNKFISAFEFGPDGHTFDCGAGPLPVLCIDWVDDDNDGRLDKPPYAYGNTTFEKNIRMTWEHAGEITRRCGDMEPCPVGSDLFPGWHPPTPAEPNTRTDTGNELLGACCDETENRLCVEVTGFSSFAIGTERPPCTGSIGGAKLKVLKLHKEVGEQKIVLKGEVQLPTGEGSDAPVPDIDPIANGVQVVLREGSGATFWSADIPPGAFDNGSRTGWKSNKAGTVFNFKAKGRDDGVSKVVVKKAYGKQPGRVDVKVVAKTASVELDLEDLDTSGAPPPCESGCGLDASGCCPEPSIEGLWQGSLIASGPFALSGPLDLDFSSSSGGVLAVDVDAAGFLFDGPASQACGEVRFLDAGGDGFEGSFNEDKTCASGTFTVSVSLLEVSGTWEACRTTPLEEPLCEQILPLEAEVSLLGGDENQCGTTQFQDPPQRPFCFSKGLTTALICR